MQIYLNRVSHRTLLSLVALIQATICVCFILPVVSLNARQSVILRSGTVSANPGELITATYSGFTPEKKSAWIGLFRKDAPSDDYIHYAFLNNLKNQTYDVKAPLEHGEYNFRIFADETYTPLAISPAVFVGKAQDGETFHYDGKSEADGRSAGLDLVFRNGRVSGRLQAKGVNDNNIRLPSTDIKFGESTFSGKWESRDACIDASWTGGDYIDGSLMPGYPATGQLRIRLEERNGEEVVFLHRIATSKYGYVFPVKGCVYDSGDSAESTSLDSKTGQGNPVGEWTCRVELRSALMTAEEKLSMDYLIVFEPSGRVKVTVASLKSGGRMETEDSITMEARWKLADSGVSINQWKEPPGVLWEMDDNNEVTARFQGADVLVFDIKQDSGSDDKVCVINSDESTMVFRRKGKVRGKTGRKDDTAPVNLPDKDEIQCIELEPDSFKMTPAARRELPVVIAIVKQTLDRVPLESDDVDWSCDKGGSIEEGAIILDKNVQPGDTLTLVASLKDSPVPCEAQARIQAVSELKYGSVSAFVLIEYTGVSREQSVERKSWPNRPESAVVELRPSFGPEKTVQSKIFRPGSDIIFKNIEPGRYNLWITKITLPELPHGYVPKKELPVRSIGWVEIPDERMPDAYNQKTAARFEVHVPGNNKEQSTSGFVYGRILYKGAPVPGATINVTLPPYAKRLYYSDDKGEFAIDTTELDSGEYRITVEKFVKARIAGPGDYLDVANTKNQQPVIFHVPLTDFNGLNLDVDVLTRTEIFGSGSGQEPLALP